MVLYPQWRSVCPPMGKHLTLQLYSICWSQKKMQYDYKRVCREIIKFYYVFPPQSFFGGHILENTPIYGTNVSLGVSLALQYLVYFQYCILTQFSGFDLSHNFQKIVTIFGANVRQGVYGCPFWRVLFLCLLSLSDSVWDICFLNQPFCRVENVSQICLTAQQDFPGNRF